MKCDNKELIDQFKRSNGQVASIGRMIDDNRDRADVLQQIVAARASLTKLGVLLLEAEARGCLGANTEPNDKIKNFNKVVTELFKLT